MYKMKKNDLFMKLLNIIVKIKFKILLDFSSKIKYGVEIFLKMFKFDVFGKKLMKNKLWKIKFRMLE